MSPLAAKIQWVVALLIEEQSGKLRARDIARTTGFQIKDVEDAIYDLYQRGQLIIWPNSTLAMRGYD